MLLFLAAALFRAPVRVARVLWPLALLAGSVLFVTGLLVPAYLLTAAGLGGCLACTDTADDDGRAATTDERGADDGQAGRGAGGRRRSGCWCSRWPRWPLRRLRPGVPQRLGAGRHGRPGGSGGGYRAHPAGAATPGPMLPTTVRVAALAGLTALAGLAAVLHVPPAPARATAAPAARPRVAACNIRMGFGLDGRLDLDAVARELRGADVVLLSEVDRGWWLNGGHDTLALLAGRLGMPYVFGPPPTRSGATRCSAVSGCGPGRRGG
ncbi:hypothetical protein V2I01_22330 [Micromonospora sp. BRA006-A]|nr:hypothetical protein [Micromonospora sp. BRA006-A]